MCQNETLFLTTMVSSILPRWCSAFYTNNVRFFSLHVTVQDILLLLIANIIQDDVINLNFTTASKYRKSFPQTT